MQGFLFEEEERIIDGIDDLIMDVYKAGKSAKFLHCHVRSYNQHTSQPITAILKALQDLETIGQGLCISAGKMSPKTAKKTSSQKHIFLSSLKDSEIVITTKPESIKSIFKDLEMAVFNIRKRLNSVLGKTKIGWAIMAEKDIMERYVDLCMGVARLQTSLKNEINGF